MERKWVHFLYAMASLALLFCLSRPAVGYGGFAKPAAGSVWRFNLVAGVIAWLAWSNEELFNLASECVAELKRLPGPLDGKPGWPPSWSSSRSLSRRSS